MDDLIFATVFEFFVAVGGTVITSLLALFYLRRVRLERPPVGVFNGRDIAVLLCVLALRLFPVPYEWGRRALLVAVTAAVGGGGEALLPPEGAVGLLSRAVLWAAMPLVWVSRWRIVTWLVTPGSGSRSSGSTSATGASRSRRPSSASRITTVVVNTLVIDPIWNSVSVVTVTPVSLFRTP